MALRIFPNPTTDKVDVDLLDYIGRAVRIEVYSMLGQKVYSVEIDELQTRLVSLDLSQYQAGTYLVRATTDGAPAATEILTKK